MWYGTPTSNLVYEKVGMRCQMCLNHREMRSAVGTSSLKWKKLSRRWTFWYWSDKILKKLIFILHPYCEIARVVTQNPRSISANPKELETRKALDLKNMLIQAKDRGKVQIAESLRSNHVDYPLSDDVPPAPRMQLGRYIVCQDYPETIHRGRLEKTSSHQCISNVYNRISLAVKRRKHVTHRMKWELKID